MPRTYHIQIQSDDPDRASRFYSRAFGWRMRRDKNASGYSFAAENGTDMAVYGDITRRDEVNRRSSSTVHVPRIEDALVRVTASGGKVVVPKKTIPGVGYMAYCEDPEGNVFSLFQRDKTVR